MSIGDSADIIIFRANGPVRAVDKPGELQMSISSLGFSGAGEILSLLKPAVGTRVSSAGNEGSYIQTSPDVSHPVTTDIDAINIILSNLPDPHSASNENLLVYSLDKQISSSSGDLSGVQSTISTYTDSFSGPNQSTNWAPTPSAQFLADLKAIGDAAASGDVTAAKSDLTTAENDAWTNVSKPTSGVDGVLRSNANIRDGLEMEGYSVADATAQADAITLGGLVPTTGDATADKKRSSEISDLARVLSLEAGSFDKKTAQASDAALSDIVNRLLGATSASAANQTLAALDTAYGSQNLSVQG